MWRGGLYCPDARGWGESEAKGRRKRRVARGFGRSLGAPQSRRNRKTSTRHYPRRMRVLARAPAVARIQAPA